MRREDRQLKDINDIFEIIENCTTVRLAMIDEGKPYLVALNYGYEREGDDLILYFHGAAEGRKINIWKKAPEVCFEMDLINEFVHGTEQNPCSFSCRFDSIMGTGKVEFITGNDEKSWVVNRVIQHITKTDKTFVFPQHKLDAICTYKVVAKGLTGKRHE